MRQMTLASASFERYGKLTRRAAFLTEMEKVVPWGELCAVVEPAVQVRNTFSNSGASGRI